MWAHNSHIGDARATEMGAVRGEHNIGQLVRERWGDDVALIGFGTHTGTVTAATTGTATRETKRVLPSRTDSYERQCHDSGVPRFLLDLPGRRRSAAPAAGRAAARTFHRRDLSARDRALEPLQRGRAARSSSTLTCGSTRPRALEPAGHEPDDGVPDTYPFGV